MARTSHSASTAWTSPGELLKKFPKGYKPKDLFEFWYNDIKSIEPGRFSVIGADPISDIEDGMVDWVKSRFKEFGFSSAEKFQSTGGIFWSRVTSEWKRILAGPGSALPDVSRSQRT